MLNPGCWSRTERVTSSGSPRDQNARQGEDVRRTTEGQEGSEEVQTTEELVCVPWHCYFPPEKSEKSGCAGISTHSTVIISFHSPRKRERIELRPRLANP